MRFPTGRFILLVRNRAPGSCVIIPQIICSLAYLTLISYWEQKIALEFVAGLALVCGLSLSVAAFILALAPMIWVDSLDRPDGFGYLLPTVIAMAMGWLAPAMFTFQLFMKWAGGQYGCLAMSICFTLGAWCLEFYRNYELRYYCEMNRRREFSIQ